jgi:hypothetical protein
MTATLDAAAADPQRTIADLRRELDEYTEFAIHLPRSQQAAAAGVAA